MTTPLPATPTVIRRRVLMIALFGFAWWVLLGGAELVGLDRIGCLLGLFAASFLIVPFYRVWEDGMDRRWFTIYMLTPMLAFAMCFAGLERYGIAPPWDVFAPFSGVVYFSCVHVIRMWAYRSQPDIYRPRSDMTVYVWGLLGFLASYYPLTWLVHRAAFTELPVFPWVG